MGGRGTGVGGRVGGWVGWWYCSFGCGQLEYFLIYGTNMIVSYLVFLYQFVTLRLADVFCSRSI